MKKILILIKTKKEIQLAIDMALAISAFDSALLSIVFMDEASKELVKSSPETNFQKQIQAWPWYDIRCIYFSKLLLQHSHLTTESLLLPATPLSQDEINTLISKQDILLSY